MIENTSDARYLVIDLDLAVHLRATLKGLSLTVESNVSGEKH